MATFRTKSFTEINRDLEDAAETTKDFDYLFSDGVKMRTERKLLKEALEDAAEPAEQE